MSQLVGKRSNNHQSRIYADPEINQSQNYDEFQSKIRK